MDQNRMRKGPKDGNGAAVPPWMERSLLALDSVRPAPTRVEREAFRDMARFYEPFTKVADQAYRRNAAENMATNLAKAGDLGGAKQALQRAFRR